MTRRLIPLANLVLNALAALVIATTATPVLRDLACVVVVFGTGFALVPLLRLHDLALETMLVMLTSIVTLICVTMAVTYIAFFSWRPCELIMLAITVLGSVAQLLLPAPEQPYAQRGIV